MSEPLSLPLEIYYRIMTQVTQHKDLSALSLCCRDLRDEAQRELFRHPFDSDLTFIQQKAFFDAIISSPIRLGPMVISCTIRQLSRKRSDIGQARSAAATALLLMCNLRTLKVDGAWSIDRMKLLDCSFQLDILVVGFPGYSSVIDPLLFDFLRKQPSLRHLRIYHRLGPENRSSTQSLRDDTVWCPNLVSLGIEEDLAEIFLAKHRPIKHLDWYSTLPSTLSPLRSTHVSSLQYLSCSTFTVGSPSGFQALQKMTSLVLLDVFIQSVDVGELAEKLHFLEYATQLRYLIITGFISEFATEQPGSEDARTVFKLCPSLDRIDISVSAIINYLKFETFERVYAHDSHDDMGMRVVQARDVYAWKAIEESSIVGYH